LFSDILQASFPYAPKSGKTAILTPKSGEKPEKSSSTTFLGPFPGSTSFGVPGAHPSGFLGRTIMDINMDTNNDDRKDVQPYPVELWTDRRRRGEGNSPLSRRGRGGTLATDLVAGGTRGRRWTGSSGRSSWSVMPCARPTPGKPITTPSTILSVAAGRAILARVGAGLRHLAREMKFSPSTINQRPGGGSANWRGSPALWVRGQRDGAGDCHGRRGEPKG